MARELRDEACAEAFVSAARIVDGVKVYGTGDTAVTALDHVAVEFATGTLTAVMGPSGSGKSTLLHCMAGLDRLTAGSAFIAETDLSSLDDRALTLLRRDRIGFVFQSYNLVPTLTARENICLPLTLAGRRPDPTFFADLIGALRIGDRLAHRPGELSGGQQQRVAVARALITRPALVFADEPTGNLDSRSAHELLAEIRAAVDRYGQSVVMVTHDPGAAGWADRVVLLADGRVVGELARPTPGAILSALQGIEA
jgi:putative ABC transport system ATP-binding protein